MYKFLFYILKNPSWLFCPDAWLRTQTLQKENFSTTCESAIIGLAWSVVSCVRGSRQKVAPPIERSGWEYLWGGPHVTKELRWKQGHVGDAPVAMTHRPGEMPRLRAQRELEPQTHHWFQVFCMQNTLQKVCNNGVYLFWSCHENSFCGLLFWVVVEIYSGFPTY